MRRLTAGLVAACVAGSAPAQWAATGQTTAARGQAPQASGDVYVMKSAGGPERKLRLLKLGTGPDGDRFADVEDVASGARYTLPQSALAGLRRATDASPPANAPPAAAANGGKFPTSLPLPEPAAGSHSPFAARPLPTPEARPQPRSRPSWADGPPQPMPGPAEPPTLPPVPPQAAPPVVPAVQPAAFAAPALSAPAVAQWQQTRADQMHAETDPYTRDLLDALRPSVRERAATALANSRHASHPEVKRLLARAAATDPAPGVQAHCVRLLAALGYHDREHVEFLEAAAGGEHPGLRRAAQAALAKLAPK